MKIQALAIALLLSSLAPIGVSASSMGCSNMKACEQSCQSAAKYARTKKGAMYAEIAKKAEDCAELCRVSESFSQRSSGLSEKLAALCAEACSSCAKACEASKDKMLKACIETCKKCADCCTSEADTKGRGSSNTEASLIGREKLQGLLGDCCKR